MTDSDRDEQGDVKKTLSVKRVLMVAVPVIVVLAIVLMGRNTATSTSQKPPVKDEERLNVLEIRLQNLENGNALYAERLTKLEKELETEKQVLATATAAATTRPAAEGASSSGASVSPVVAAAPEDTKRLEVLEKELADMKASAPLQDSAHIARSIKLLSAFHRLSDKVLYGKPYAEQLTEFAELIADSSPQNKALADIALSADSGIPTQSSLLTSFDEAVRQLNIAQSVPPAEAGAWDRFLFNMSHIVRVERIDQKQVGKDVDAIVGRALDHLEKGEVEAAYSEINSLPEQALKVFTDAGWLHEAQTAIDTPGVVDQLEEQVMQQVFQPATETKGPISSDKGLNIQ